MEDQQVNEAPAIEAVELSQAEKQTLAAQAAQAGVELVGEPVAEEEAVDGDEGADEAAAVSTDGDAVEESA